MDGFDQPILNIQGKGIPLGGGNHWFAYQVELFEPLEIRGKEYNSVVCKILKDKNVELFSENKKNYRKCLNANVPTLAFVEFGIFQNEKCLVVENLKKREGTCYVSPNTRTDTKAHESNEEILRQNKMCSIDNLDEILESAQKDLHRISLCGMQLPWDAYFFGVEMEKPNQIKDYLVADYDCIEINCFESRGLFKENMYEFLQSIYQFIEEFVENSAKKKEMMKKVTSLSESFLGCPPLRLRFYMCKDDKLQP